VNAAHHCVYDKPVLSLSARDYWEVQEVQMTDLVGFRVDRSHVRKSVEFFDAFELSKPVVYKLTVLSAA